MAQKLKLPEITKEELLEAISEGVDRAVYRMITDRYISFFDSVEEGVRQATKGRSSSAQAT